MAYGARLESVLGESPRGFESPILRGRTPQNSRNLGGFSLILGRHVQFYVQLEADQYSWRTLEQVE